MSDTQQRIDELVKSNPVVLFMKGTPDFPQCGFSAQTGHFTQVVWAETTRLGCGVSRCGSTLMKIGVMS